MADRYKITVEFLPDLAGDPDAFRLHRETPYEVLATKEVAIAVREFEGRLIELSRQRREEAQRTSEERSENQGTGE